MNPLTDFGPFEVNINFRPLKDKIVEDLKTTENKAIRRQYEWMLEIFEKNPALEKGFSNPDEMKPFQEQIDELMSFLFPNSLSENEIKAAFSPLFGKPFYVSNRLKNIKNSVEENVEEELGNLFSNAQRSVNYLMYAGILNFHYNFPVDLDKVLSLKLTNKNGKVHTYRITMNGDFLNIKPNKNAVEITEEIFIELMKNPNDLSVWEKYFPRNSWVAEGFGIITLHDVTVDEKINQFKTHLIQPGGTVNFDDIINDIRSIFGIPNLQIGTFHVEDNFVFRDLHKPNECLSIDPSEKIPLYHFASENIVNQLFEKRQTAIIPDVSSYIEEFGEDRFVKVLKKNGIQSLLLIPIIIEEKAVFILEIGSKERFQLNAINYLKFLNIMPFVESFAARTKNEFENTISAIIQRECTSIHPSVEWRFQEEAMNFLNKAHAGETPNFRELKFENVFPLYGQTDIVNSSNERNHAIYEDLKSQLSISKSLLTHLFKSKKMPIHEQLIYRIENFEQQIENHFNTNTEQEVNQFFISQIYPVLNHSKNEFKVFEIQEFLDSLDENHHSLYNARKNYDQTVELINKEMSQFLEVQQQKAQKMFPHYFEKYKTDGIEHNMYIGQSLVNKGKYHNSYLHNLRLWQLQTICEMEALYYEHQKDFPLALNVASLIFAYEMPINIRYRIDEKKFDVDGAYNVRYEILKKRIDKAHIKNTNERLTQVHKLCVVYSTSNLEREYLQYFEFLQAKNYIGKNIEIVELEELQGASGLKAIRVDLNHDIQPSKKTFTVEDVETYNLS